MKSSLLRRPEMSSRKPRVRFEDQIGIELMCCKTLMVLRGNLSLRGASGGSTVLAYECLRCHRRVSVADDWTASSSVVDSAHDVEP
jgi:hypothetical protein